MEGHVRAFEWLGGVPRECVDDNLRSAVARRERWIKRGPSGVIGTNKKCATDTVTALLEDRAAGALVADGDNDTAGIEADLLRRRPELVTYAGWEAIDAAERARANRRAVPA